ncbi:MULTISPECIES: hypothetical protein [Bradyrhizobium]|uniref:Uncharacterized protein n=2 Tax=Bradyrhizobium TaxID=374 RepID=A0ABY0QFB2_9BRAD|nr:MULTISPECIES: hypothetical protein [Bradyrhizobium]SDK14525.1 hypothetical protein SAMN05444163_7352 [Bradyrhizobium ottawaense]SEE50733.1 hypothetical protein SAMN05444171_7779 [Bradyrhizobium lablabi]
MADFNDEAARHRGKQLIVTRKQAEAHLAYAEANGDLEYAAEKIQEIANIDREGENLNRLFQQYTEARQAPTAPSSDAWRTKKSEEMTPEDVRLMLNDTSATAKIGGGITYEENVNQLRKLAQAKARGDYHGKP